MVDRGARVHDNGPVPGRADDPGLVLIEHLLGTPQARSLLDAAASALASVGDFVERAGGTLDRRRDARDSSPAAPSPTRERPTPISAARAVLHFAPDEPVTADAVRKRRKELARLCHSDLGGSDVAMRRVNQAAQILLRSLE